MKRKGFYIKKNDKGMYLNIFKPDFVQYINDQDGDWVKFLIHEKEQDSKGFCFDMKLIRQIENNKDSSNNNTDTTIL